MFEANGALNVPPPNTLTNENTYSRNTLGFTHYNSKFLVKVFGSFYIVLAAHTEFWTPAALLG